MKLVLVVGNRFFDKRYVIGLAVSGDGQGVPTSSDRGILLFRFIVLKNDVQYFTTGFKRSKIASKVSRARPTNSIFRFGVSLTQQEDGRSVGVYDIHQLRVGRIESGVRRHPLKVRFGRVQPGDPAQSFDVFARVSGRVGAQAVSYQMNMFRI